MHAFTGAAILLVSSSTAAAAAAGLQLPRAPPASATDPWVTVGDDGVPKTVTPVVTTISGTPTVISGAPDALTASVVTQTTQGLVRTSTIASGADAPQPTATATDGAGAFPVCRNKNGPHAPFCLPADGTTLNPGTTYYVTWDPTFFNGTNTTVVVTGSFFNGTTGLVLSQAFTSQPLAAGWSFFSWNVDPALLTANGGNGGGVNIALNIAALASGSASMNPFRGPTVAVANPPIFHQEPTQRPTGPALYIGLPTVLGFVILILIGTYIWNRSSRKIGLGNIMSRSRSGYGVGKSRSERQRRQRKEGIHLLDRDLRRPASSDSTTTQSSSATPSNSNSDNKKRDHPRGAWYEHQDHRDDAPAGRHGIPRRDSDALGSLADAPIEDHHLDFSDGGRTRGGHSSSNNNVFRDELRRQERDGF